MALILLITLYAFGKVSEEGMHLLLLALVCGAAVVDAVLDVETDIKFAKIAK